MELRQATKEQIIALRAGKEKEIQPPIVPGFYAGLVEEAAPFLIVEAGSSEAISGRVLGYALLLDREHDGHVHTTLIELGLDEGHRDRYEDVLDLVRDHASPTAYLVRTDDCRLNATLLSRGLQVEATALVLVPKQGPPAERRRAAETGPSEAKSPAAGAGASRSSPQQTARSLELASLTRAHLPGIAELLEAEGPEPLEVAPGHRRSPSRADTLEEVALMAEAGEGWALLENGEPQAVIARLAAGRGEYELLDFVVAQGEEAALSWGIARATEAVEAAGRRPGAVIDALDPVRRRILRAAGYYTTAAYMVFYDPAAGRPSVPTVGLEELREMIAREERFRLVDVMGEEHWKAGHLPGAEWIDFRGLGREARKRYEQDETIIVYCNGFT